MRSSVVFAGVLAAVAAAAAGASGQSLPAAGPVVAGQYQHSLDLVQPSSSFVFHWTIENGNTLSAALESDNCNGYLAWGYAASMADSDVTLGWVNETSGVATVMDMQVNGGGSPPVLDTDNGGADNILESNGYKSGSVQNIRWRRLLNTGDSYDDILTAPSDVTTGLPFIAACGATTALTGHPFRTGTQTDTVSIAYFQPVGSCTPACGTLGVCSTATNPPICNCNTLNSERLASGACGCVQGYIETANGCEASSLTTDELSSVSTANLGDIGLSWEFGDDEDITIRLTYPENGWIAIGFGKSMADSDTYVGAADATGVQDARTEGQFAPIPDGVQNVDDFLVEFEDGQLVVVFRRKLDTGDETDFVIPSGSQETDIIVAASPDPTRGAKHTERFAVSVNFATGASTDLQTPHAILMSLAWGLFTIVALFLAKFFKSIGHAWFIAHAALNTAAIIFTIIGFILAVIMVDQDFAQGGVAQVHSILGLSVLILSVIQAVIGVLADKMWSPDRDGTPFFPDKLHWWLGRVTMLAAVVTMFLGVPAINGDFYWYIVLGVYFLIVVVVYVILEVKGVGEEH